MMRARSRDAVRPGRPVRQVGSSGPASSPGSVVVSGRYIPEAQADAMVHVRRSRSISRMNSIIARVARDCVTPRG
jgi:hypothetical protein